MLDQGLSPLLNQSDTSPPQSQARSRPRRGATAMEYLFVASLILVVLLSGVNYFGQQTKKIADDAATTIQNATQKNNQSGK
jgi:Flp pilus assembly pilin Flp